MENLFETRISELKQAITETSDKISIKMMNETIRLNQELLKAVSDGSR